MQRGHDEEDAERHEQPAQHVEADRRAFAPDELAVAEAQGKREEGHKQGGRNKGGDDNGHEVEPVDGHLAALFDVDFLCDFFLVDFLGCCFALTWIGFGGRFGFFFLRTFGATKTPGSGWWKLRWSTLLRRE